jgi:hypothetical protein
MNQLFDTPILFLIFNRPDTTQMVFDAIKKQKPKYLYVAADGPRSDKKGEVERCQETRNIIKQVDWDCDVKTLFRKQNMGCGKAVSSAISWFFENVEQGIILEDDCLPNTDFFPYCEELLLKYNDNEEVMLISGNNFQDGIKRGEASYYFSAYPHIWGWASWRSTWKNYDFLLNNYSSKEFKSILKQYFPLWTERQVWLDKFILMKKQSIDTWDHQLTFSIWKKKGLAILPNVNLISNIGFGENAAHTFDVNHKYANMQHHNILPLKHAEEVIRNDNADAYYYKTYNYKSPFRLLYRAIKRLIQ